MVLRTLIVDDEAPARQRLKRLLADIEGVEIIGEAASGIQAVEKIERERPDLVLLDIQMPGLDGFEVIEALEAPSPVIFVTAYDEYAIRAFEVNALDYLLKPFSRERLAKAIRRAQEALAEERSFAARLGPLLESLAAQGRYLTRLAVRDGDRIRVLDVDEVERGHPLVQGKPQAAADHRRRGGPEPGTGTDVAQDTGLVVLQTRPLSRGKGQRSD